MEPLFTTQSLTLPAAANIPAEGETKFCIFVSYDHRRYVFRFAYASQEQANSVLGNLKRSFGKPVSINTDLANNYHRYISNSKLIFSQSRKHTYHVVKGL